ncbi:hypothetical protein JW960_20870 [candidate division KSB1 bacterium]|nr:hypothetical protein [candidate division KSB1 bacterium]
MKTTKPAKLHKKFRSLIITNTFYFIFGLGIIGVGVYSTYCNVIIVRNARHTIGVVVRVHREAIPGKSDPLAMFDIQYNANDSTYTTRKNQGQMLTYVNADSVPIIYDTTNPVNANVGEKPHTNYIPGILIILAGLGFSIFNIHHYIKNFKKLRNKKMLFHNIKFSKATVDPGFGKCHAILFRIMLSKVLPFLR